MAERQAMTFELEPGANPRIVEDRLRCAARNLPVEAVEFGPVNSDQDRASLVRIDRVARAEQGDDWNTCAAIVVERECCPHCGTARLPVRIRIMPADDDGNYIRRNVCANCSRRFVTIVALPSGGKIETTPG